MSSYSESFESGDTEIFLDDREDYTYELVFSDEENEKECRLRLNDMQLCGLSRILAIEGLSVGLIEETEEYECRPERDEIIEIAKPVPEWVIEDFDDEDKQAYGDGRKVLDAGEKWRLIDKYLFGSNFYGVTLKRSYIERCRQDNQQEQAEKEDAHTP